MTEQDDLEPARQIVSLTCLVLAFTLGVIAGILLDHYVIA